MRIIPRSEWGAKHPDGFTSAPLPAKLLFIHHSVTVAPDLLPPFTDDYAAVRLLEEIGQARFGGGISYTFVITPAGLIFQGHSINRQGAHTRGLNDIARAICHVGNYSVMKPTNMQLDATRWLIDEGKRAHWWPSNVPIDGHRNAPGATTECPGNYLYAALPIIRQPYDGPTQEDIVMDKATTDFFNTKFGKADENESTRFAALTARVAAVEAAINADPDNPVTQDMLNEAVKQGLAGMEIAITPGAPAA